MKMLIILNKFSLLEHNCHLLSVKYINRGFPGGTSGKEPTCQSTPASAGDARDSRLIPGLGRFLEKEWQPTPLSCLDNSMDRGAHWATVHEVAKSRRYLSTHPVIQIVIVLFKEVLHTCASVKLLPR